MLDEFEKWFLSQKLKERGIEVGITKGAKTDNSAIYADLFTDKFFGRATLWESNEFNLEAIDAHSEASIINEYYTIASKDELYTLLKNFVSRLLNY